MIKKLSKRIFFLIMISLSTVVLGIIILFAILNYKNTISTATFVMDKFANKETKLENPIPKVNIEGLYYVQVENAQVIGSSDASPNKEIEEYAIKVSKGKSESGIIENYIYKARKLKNNISNVILIKNEEAILHTKMIVMISIIISILSLIIIYIIAKKVSKFIVKPVENTFEKQKQFISDASHELKTPLAVIEANADVLETEVGNNKWLKYIQNEIESMNKLINELLLLAKIENIDNMQENSEFDLSKETQIITSMFESMAYEKKAKLSTNIQKNIMMNGNKEDIEHILSTIIDNAINHTEFEKQVIVELIKEKNDIILQIKNTGKPIPESEREKIFERFYRIDKSRNRSEKRYGLGLAIAKSTVDKYKGNIQVGYENNFTIFKITIPV